MGEKVCVGDLVFTEKCISDEVYRYATYNGAAFTGVAYKKTEPYYTIESHYYEDNYLNGFQHGRCFAVDMSGHLYERFMEHGNHVSSVHWYPSGAKKSFWRKEPHLSQVWSETGVLLEEENGTFLREYYLSGKLRSEFIKRKGYAYFDESGEWAMRYSTDEAYIRYGNGYKYAFNDACVSKNYMRLLRDYTFYKYFVIWLDKANSAERESIIINLITSSTLWHKYHGIDLAAEYKVRSAIPCIKQELGNDVIPPSHRSVEGLAQRGYKFTIAQRAKIALEEIL